MTAFNLSPQDKARTLAALNPTRRWAFDAKAGVVAFHDSEIDEWIAYTSLGLDGRWYDAHHVLVDGEKIDRSFVEVELVVEETPAGWDKV